MPLHRKSVRATLDGLDHCHIAVLRHHLLKLSYVQRRPSFPLVAPKDLAFHLQAKRFQGEKQLQRVNEFHSAACLQLGLQNDVRGAVGRQFGNVTLARSWRTSFHIVAHMRDELFSDEYRRYEDRISEACLFLHHLRPLNKVAESQSLEPQQ